MLNWIAGIIFLTVVLGMFGAAAIYLLWQAWSQWEEASRSATWTTTAAKRWSVSLDEQIGNRTIHYEVKVKYFFLVRGKTYRRSCVAIGYSGSANREAEEELADRISGAVGLQVRYDPEQPKNSCLTYATPPRQAIINLTGATLVILMITFFGLGVILTQFGDEVLIQSLEVFP